MIGMIVVREFEAICYELEPERPPSENLFVLPTEQKNCHCQELNLGFQSHNLK